MTDRLKRLMAGNPAIDKLAQSHLLGLIQPDDIANAALYLASDEARMVTGHLLVVDAGRTTNGGSARFARATAGLVEEASSS